MTEGMSVEIGPGGEKSEEFKQSWLFKEKVELEKLHLDPKTKFGKAINLLHKTPLTVLDNEGLKTAANNIFQIALEEDVPEDVYGFIVGRISDTILQIGKPPQDIEDKTLGGAAIEELVKVNKDLLKSSERQLSLQERQMELLRKSGFSGFISALEARAGIDVQQFDTEVPVWYDSLSREWKSVVRTNLGILLGSYYKLRSPVKGAEMIISSEDIRIERDAVAFMWEKTPGFRQAMGTMVFELFEEKDGKLFLTEEGKKKLSSVEDYKKSLEDRICSFLNKDETRGVFDLVNLSGGPDELTDPETAARFAVATAFNFFYLGGVFESGDLGKGLKDPQVFNPSVRTFYLPWDQAKSKYIIGESDVVGTDEAWGGKLGEWFAERIRHNDAFKEDFLNRRGITRLMPKRLMYSLFDLTYFNNGESLSKALASVFLESNRLATCEPGLVDFKNSNLVNWKDLKYQELWGGYSDVMDSAWKVYQAIIGKADTREFDRQTLANALAKLRKHPTLKTIYTGEEGEWVLTAALVSLLGGPHLYSSEILLRLPEENYDYQIWWWLNDDRLYAGLPAGARGRIFSRLNAKDLDSLVGSFVSDIQGTALGKRERIRSQIRREQIKFR